MSDFMRSIKITDLVNKSNYWSPQKIAQYHNNITAASKLSVSKRDGTGYINATVKGVEYVEISNGATFAVLNTPDEKSWNCFNDLYAKSQELGTFRIEKPVYRTLSSGKDYREISSPNNEFGTAIVNKMHDGSFTSADDMVSFIKQFITDAAVVFAQMKLIAGARGAGIPIAVFNISNYWQDSNGVYFTNLDTDWAEPNSSAIATGLGYIEASLASVGKSKLTDAQITEIKTFARSSWT